MPLKTASNRTKEAINRAVSANIHELAHNGKKERSHKQIVAISEAVARKKKAAKK